MSELGAGNLDPSILRDAIQTLPAGSYAVACSGGADSTALVRLMASRVDLRGIIVHLNHELRGEDSEVDAAFVADLANSVGWPAVIARRSEIEPTLSMLPTNPSARYRAVRLALFGQVVRDHRLAGVVLAHHADDQAETVFLRLLRGAGAIGLCGMSPIQRIGDLHLFRPLLGITRSTLRTWLNTLPQPWREDQSNTSSTYRRNVVRQILADSKSLTAEVLQMQTQSQRWCCMLDQHIPGLHPVLHAQDFADLPTAVQDHFLRRWLMSVGIRPEDIAPSTCAQLRNQCMDAASARRQSYPGGILVARKKSGVYRVQTPRP